MGTRLHPFFRSSSPTLCSGRSIQAKIVKRVNTNIWSNTEQLSFFFPHQRCCASLLRVCPTRPGPNKWNVCVKRSLPSRLKCHAWGKEMSPIFLNVCRLHLDRRRFTRVDRSICVHTTHNYTSLDRNSDRLSHLSTCRPSRPVLPLAYLLIQKIVFPIPSPPRREASLGTDLETRVDPLGSRRCRGSVLGKKNVDACFTLSFQIEISLY